MIIPREGMDRESGRPAAGILVSRIVDAMDVEVDLRDAEQGAPGLQGTAIVNDQLTLFLEPDELMAATGVADRSH
jgi:two-component system chemotaxis sensor kinase CheA